MRQPKESPYQNSTHEIFDVNGFPFRECRRCDGTGIHQYNTVTGNVCFKCQGSGSEIAPRAKEAYVAWRTHLKSQYEALVKNLKVGDEILWDKSWRVVKSITRTDKPCAWKRENGGPEIAEDWYHILEFVDGVEKVSGNCVYRRRARDLDPSPFVAMIKAPEVKKKAGLNAP